MTTPAEPVSPAEIAIAAMKGSVDYSVKEVFFAMWAKHLGIDWDGLTTSDRYLVMSRLEYLWRRAIPR
jgi:hypothetical protein